MGNYGDICSKEKCEELRRVARSLRSYAKEPEDAYQWVSDAEHRQYVHEYTYTRYVYRRQFRWWGKWEDSVVTRLKKILQRGTLDKHKAQVFALLKKYQQVHELGWGYVYGDLSDAQRGVLTENWVAKHAALFQQEDNIDGIWFCDVARYGLPRAVSDFHVIPRYAVINEATGRMIRYVVLENMRGGRTDTVPLPAMDFVAPEKFRRWIAEMGRFTFGVGQRAGITELNMLQLDTNSLLELFTVTEYNRFGWQELPGSLVPKDWDESKEYGLWTFRDGILFPDGKFVKPNRDGVISWRGHKFRMGEVGPDGQGFKLTRDPFWSSQLKCKDLAYLVADDDWRRMHDQLTERDHLRGFFVELCRRLDGTFGQHDWVLLLGGLFAYGVAPEVFKKYFQFPGSFVHGQAGSGKSYVVMWLMELFGFDALQPMMLRGGGVTEVGVEQAISQYSNLPLWADEFAVGGVSENMIGLFRNAFGRGGVAKHGLGRDDRRPSTMFLLSGENTSSDAAMRGRYVHVFISKHDRKQNNLAWFNKHRKWFVLLWRELLKRRTEFVDLFYQAYQNWELWCEGSDCGDPRAHFIYGVHWASFEAFSSLLGAFREQALVVWRQHAIRSMGAQQAEVSESTRANVFWRDFLTAVDTRDVSLDWIDVEEVSVDYPLNLSAQSIPNKPWKKAFLYFMPNKVRDGINAYRRKRGEPPMMDTQDLLSQMKPYEYFDHKAGTRRFGRHSSAGGVRCWRIDVDLHELGLRQVSDSVFHEWLERNPSGRNDIRRGELYGLVDTWNHYRAEESADEQTRMY